MIYSANKFLCIIFYTDKILIDRNIYKIINPLYIFHIMQIFVIQLENDKWFLTLSTQTKYDYVMFEAQSIHDFVRKNPPIKIYETINSRDNYEINTLTKKYMSCIGIEHVRGGIYSDEILPDYLLKSLELELNNNCSQKTHIFENMRTKPELILDDFIKRADNYSELFKLGYQEITRNFFTDLEWLENKINNSEVDSNIYHKMTNEENTKYNNLLRIMDIIRDKYFKLEEDKIKVEYNIVLKYPKFTLDFFVYHRHFKKDWENYKIVALELIKKYEYMGYTLLNIIDFAEFDFFHH